MKIVDKRERQAMHLISISEGGVFLFRESPHIRLTNDSEGNARFASLATGEAFIGNEKLIVTKVDAELVIR